MLPRPDGPYDVGLTTLAFQVPKRVVGKGTFKANGNPALVLQEVAFALYYPSAVRETKTSNFNSKRVSGVKLGVKWLQKPPGLALAGWAHFLHFSSVLLWPIIQVYNMLLSVPAHPNVPLLSANSKSGKSHISGASSSSTLKGEHESLKSKWPFIIFSHGLGGSRTAYSHYCSQLASEGNVVLALEHHDGTCVYTTVRTNGVSNEKDDSIGLKYINLDDVDFPSDSVTENDEKEKQAMQLRKDQLEFRREEIYHAVTAFRQFVRDPSSNHGLYMVDSNERGCNIDTSFVESVKEAVHLDTDYAVTGHSFGGATLLSILSNPPPFKSAEQQYEALPITKAIALDPWMEPFPESAPPLLHPGLETSSTGPPQLLVINSEGFTLWDDHFAQLQAVVRDWTSQWKNLDGDNRSKLSTLLTLPNSHHVNFSDFPLFLPRIMQKSGDGHELLRLVHSLSMQFLLGSLHGSKEIEGYFDKLREEQKMKAFEIVKTKLPRAGDKGRRMVGSTGDVVLH